MYASLNISVPISVLLILAYCIKILVAKWTLDPDSSSTWDDESAIGVYNDTIFIIGGYNNHRQLTEYQWTTASYKIRQAASTFTVDIHGSAQFWTQHQHLIYFIRPNINKIASYNMINKQLISDVFSFPFAAIKQDTLCLTATDEYMYVVGRRDIDNDLNLVQILTLLTSQWTIITNMQEWHQSGTCIVENNYLWAFSGFETDKNERISTNNITQNEWQFVDSLSAKLFGIRCVSWKESIYIIGGREYIESEDTYFKTVHIVDVTTGAITTLSEEAATESGYTATIIVDGVLYVFGGLRKIGISGGSVLSPYNLMYYSLPSNNPTNYPSNDPSVDPSEATYDPTEATTTANPTFYPSVQSTAAPIETLSNDPTQTMSVNPTKEPTKTLIDITSDPLTATPSDDPLISYETTPNPAETPYDQTLMIINPETLETTTTNDPIETKRNTLDGKVTTPSDKDNNLMVLVFCIVIGLSLCICGVFVYIFFIGCNTKKKKKNKEHEEKCKKKKKPDVYVNKDANLQQMNGINAAIVVANQTKRHDSTDNILAADEFAVCSDSDNDENVLEMNAITEEGPSDAIDAIYNYGNDINDINQGDDEREGGDILQEEVNETICAHDMNDVDEFAFVDDSDDDNNTKTIM